MATGGGVPLKRENWGFINQAISVWLTGSTSLLARRVAKDGGENRPLVGKAESDESDESDELARIESKYVRQVLGVGVGCGVWM